MHRPSVWLLAALSATLPLAGCTAASAKTSVSQTRDWSLPPEAGPASIADALAHFRIAVPAGIASPVFTSELADRGRTLWRPFAGVTAVQIGPSAFDSWALLGSTLAHELEVHCRQNLTAISVGDVLGLPTKAAAEREAYGYELTEARRFGLRDDEVARIAAILAQLEESP